MRFFDTIINPVLWRGIERLFIVLVTAVFGWMGHRLFMFGITEGQAKLSAEGHYYKIIFSGTAPGLFLMVVAGLALLTALWKGSIKGETKDEKKDKLMRVFSFLKRFMVQLLMLSLIIVLKK